MGGATRARQSNKVIVSLWGDLSLGCKLPWGREAAWLGPAGGAGGARLSRGAGVAGKWTSVLVILCFAFIRDLAVGLICFWFKNDPTLWLFIIIPST